ncbi:MAG: hypothetical protein QOH56_490 [Pseudonocardiales bacterium]|nr:hypothetical protein [Frankiales bacterium]MDQ1734239.1 hypothetical protein [Pseudonocardiales bacterium]
MSQTMLAITAIACLVSTSMWLSLRVAAASDLAVLPSSSRRRLLWCRLNARTVYLVCGGVGLIAIVLQVRLLMS